MMAALGTCWCSDRARWYAVRMIEGNLTVHEPGERLDRAVQAALPDFSRTVIQRLIESGEIRVDGKPAKAGYKLQTGEMVSWAFAPDDPVPSEMAAESIPLEIPYEDADLIVVNKPRGLVVHPAPGHHSGTLVNAVL